MMVQPVNKVKYEFSLGVDSLEIARGYDGLLRGKPEPILILAVYITDGQVIHTLGRSIHRFFPKNPFPSIVKPDQYMTIMNILNSPASLRFVILGIALEEDRGKDVERLYGAVEHHESIMVWPLETCTPNPLVIKEVSESDWNYPTKINLFVNHSDASHCCEFDKWVGAVCWRLSGSSIKTGYRLPFQSPDQRNDWTAFVNLSLE